MQAFRNENGSTKFLGKIDYARPLENALQPNQISQGLYRCSPMAKKILAYVIADMKVVKWSNSSHETYESIFKCSSFAKSLGFKRIAAHQRDLIKQALVELQQSYIAIDTGEKFETFSWVTHSVYAEKEHTIAVEINHHLGRALMEFKKGYTAIQLLEMGRLQSFYAMRFYEIALSFSGFEGKRGNERNTWFFSYTVEELRRLFQIGDDEYAGRMTNFVTKVIQKPLEEVNQKTNIDISFAKIRDGRSLQGFAFRCSRKREEPKVTRDDTPETRDAKLEVIEEERRLEALKSVHAEAWRDILAEEMGKPGAFRDEKLNSFFAENRAKIELMRLFENDPA